MNTIQEKIKEAMCKMDLNTLGDLSQKERRDRYVEGITQIELQNERYFYN